MPARGGNGKDRFLHSPATPQFAIAHTAATHSASSVRSAVTVSKPPMRTVSRLQLMQSHPSTLKTTHFGPDADASSAEVSGKAPFINSFGQTLPPVPAAAVPPQIGQHLLPDPKFLYQSRSGHTAVTAGSRQCRFKQCPSFRPARPGRARTAAKSGLGAPGTREARGRAIIPRHTPCPQAEIYRIPLPCRRCMAGTSV